MRRVLSVVTLVCFSTICSNATAQVQSTSSVLPQATVPVEPAGPDTGSLISSPASAGRVNCWVSRSSTNAMAISIYNDGSTLSAKFRRFSKEEEEFSSKKTKILLPPAATGGAPTTVAELSTVPVRLVPVPNYDDTYTMIYDALTQNAQIEVGFVRFGRGNNKRTTSDVVVRFKNIEGAVDPCSKPPIDDIGEEEEMPEGASANSPGPSLPFTAPIAG